MFSISTIIGICILLAIIGLAINKPFRQQINAKLHGRTEAIMEKDASTVEGARDYFNAEIQKKEESYKKAFNLYTQVSGKLEELKKEKYDANKELIRINKQIELCLDQNAEEDAKIYAEKRITIEKKIEVYKTSISELTEKKEQQKEIEEQIYKEVIALKEEKERTLCQLEADEQSIQLANSIAEGIHDTESERMLEKVREGAKKKREMAAGSRIAYNSSEKASEYRLQERERDSEANRVLEEMKAKRQKRSL